MTKPRVVIWFTAFLLLSAWCTTVFCDQPDNPDTKVSPEYTAYYFFTGKRCKTCLNIEQWSKEAILRNFDDQIKAGQLQWQAINIEEPENKHFIKDFQLYTKSVIIAENNGKKPVRWVNLADIWKLSRDREKFIDYIVVETQKFMGNN